MKGPFQAVKVTDRVFWVGAIDWQLREFHGYRTPRGTTYNAFLILGDKVTLIDTVRAPFQDEMLSRIASVIEPLRIDFVISNHAEMDHSGCLPEVIRLARPDKVFASAMGARALREHFHFDQEIRAVGDGEKIALGDVTVQFFETKMLHWPDSMFSYMTEEKLLFSQDAFGMHLASGQRFDDEIDDAVLQCEAAKYYANILLPFSPVVEKLLEKVGQLGLTFNLIATDHGPIWRKGIEKIIALYARWARQERTNKAVVIYDTMWHSTEKMANAVAEGIIAEGSSVEVMPLEGAHRSDIATELLEAGALVVGSPTLNGMMYPTVADALNYLQGLRPKNLVGAAFGSYGWAREAVKQIEGVLREMKVDMVAEGLNIKYVPEREALAQCVALGRRVAQRLREKHGART